MKTLIVGVVTICAVIGVMAWAKANGRTLVILSSKTTGNLPTRTVPTLHLGRCIRAGGNLEICVSCSREDPWGVCLQGWGYS